MMKLANCETRKVAEGLDKDLEASLQENPKKESVKQLMWRYSRLWEELPAFGIGAHIKIISNIVLIRRLEQELEKSDCYPYVSLHMLLQEQIGFLTSLNMALPAIESDDDKMVNRLSQGGNYDDTKFQKIYRDLWSRFDNSLMNSFSERISKRLMAVGLNNEFFREKRVLDVGCGSGVYAVHAVLNGAKSCIGIDPNISNIRHAKEWAMTVGVGDKCNLYVGSIYNISSQSEFYDFAICSGVIHHLENPSLGLTEISRVTKYHGYLLMIVEGSGGVYRYLCDSIEKLWRQYSPDSVKKILCDYNISQNSFAFFIDSLFTIYYRQSINGYKRLLSCCGFDVVKIYRYAPLRIPYPYEQVNNFDEKFGAGNLCLLCKKIHN